MTAAQYYRHLRSLADFPACQAWEMAKEAEKLDRESAMAKIVPPGEVSWELWPDGSAVRLSRNVKVF